MQKCFKWAKVRAWGQSNPEAEWVSELSERVSEWVRHWPACAPQVPWGLRQCTFVLYVNVTSISSIYYSTVSIALSVSQTYVISDQKYKVYLWYIRDLNLKRVWVWLELHKNKLEMLASFVKRLFLQVTRPTLQTKTSRLSTSILSMLTFLYACLNSFTPTFIASTCNNVQ